MVDIGWFIFGGLFLYAIPGLIIHNNYWNEICKVLKTYKKDYPKKKIDYLTFLWSVPECKGLPHSKELDLLYQRIAEAKMLYFRWFVFGFAGYIFILFVGLLLTRIYD